MEKTNAALSKSSSLSSSESDFQDTAEKLQRCSVSLTASPGPQLKDIENDTFSESSYDSLEPDNGSQGAASPISDITHESSLSGMLPTQSPPMQLMNRSGGFDPNRIPTSVFSSKPSTPMEWSCASNESLFSIHFRNSSFSRDQSLLIVGDPYKSAELPKPEDLHQLEESHKAEELNKFSESIRYRKPSLSPKEGGSDREAPDLEIDGESKSGNTGVLDESMTVSPKESFHDGSKAELHHQAASWNPPVVSRRPDGGATRSQSSGCPIKMKCACPPCHCTGSSWLSGCCNWPHWACCSCWICKKGLCCYSSSDTLGDGVRTSANGPPLPPASAKKPKKSSCWSRWSCSCLSCASCSSCSWPSCFSCHSCCSWSSCSRCFSCHPCSSCFSCPCHSKCFSCHPCSSCFSRSSCFSCTSCPSYFSCPSCSSCHSCRSCNPCHPCRKCRCCC